MKPNSLRQVLLASGLAFCFALGAAGALVTAFDLRAENLPALTLGLAAASLYCAAVFSQSWGDLAAVLPGGLALGYLLRKGTLTQQFWQLVYRITAQYDKAYGCGVIQLVDTPWNAGTAELPLLVLGLLLAALTARTVCRGMHWIWAVALSAVPLTLTMVVTDTPPAPWCLFLLLFGQILLLLTGRVRQENRTQGHRLTVYALIPTALLLGALFLALPQKDYVNRSAELRQKIEYWMDALAPQSGTSYTPSQSTSSGSAEPEQVDLASLDRRMESPTPVMEVTAEVGGILYLRGQDYDRYTGKGWETSPHRVEAFSHQGLDFGTVAIKTRKVLSQLYLPYYPREEQSLIQGRIENTRLANTYVFTRMGLTDDWKQQALSSDPIPLSQEDSRRYRELPEAARYGAEQLLPEILGDAQTVSDKAEAIGRYVRGSASYTLDPGRMPEEEEDFALWFLNADKGYCVHFATAATVLLRAAGIEARYVSGYLVRAYPDQTVTVTGEAAHAWAEYYEPGLGAWLVVEATPSELNTPQNNAPPPTVPQQTPSEPETFPQTAPTETVPATEAPTQAPEIPGPTGDATAALPPELPETPAPLEIPWGFLGTLLTLAVLTEGQRLLRIALRRRHRGNPNARALAKWQEAEKIARLRREAPPRELEALAQKAKFSQHRLTAEELARFDNFLRRERRQLRKAPWYLRLLYRYGYAIY